MSLATEVVAAQERSLEQRMMDLARELATRPPVAGALVAHDRKVAYGDLSAAAAAVGVPAIALFDARGNLFAAAWSAQAGTQIPPEIAALVTRGLTGTSLVGPVPSWRVKTLVKLRRIRPEEALNRAVDKESFRQDRMATPSMGGGSDSPVRPPTTSRSLSG